MYAVYNYKAGALQSEVLSDLVALLTGTTDKTTLSASCVQANTSILSTEAAGWTLHDGSAGTNKKVIKALNQDASTYGYVAIDINSAPYIQWSCCEGWNASTHVATNASSSDSFTWDSSGGGYFYIYATSKNSYILPWTVAGYQGAMGVMECSRDTIPAGYPCRFVARTGISVNNNSAYFPRLKRQTGSGDYTGGSATGCLGGLISYVYDSSSVYNALPFQYSAQTYRDASENVNLAAYKLVVNAADGRVHLGTVYDLLVTGLNAGSNLDEITYSGQTYVIFKTGSAAVLVPKA